MNGFIQFWWELGNDEKDYFQNLATTQYWKTSFHKLVQVENKFRWACITQSWYSALFLSILREYEQKEHLLSISASVFPQVVSGLILLSPWYCKSTMLHGRLSLNNMIWGSAAFQNLMFSICCEAVNFNCVTVLLNLFQWRFSKADITNFG